MQQLPNNFFKVKPWDHQLQAITKAANARDGYGFFFEVGTGKTMTCINVLRLKYLEHGELLNTIIFAPVIVLENWRREILAHSNIKDSDIVVLTGTGKKRVQAMEHIKNKIVITNYEVLARMPALVEALHDFEPKVCVWDESHRCKNISSKQTKAATKISDIAWYNFLLSGTPVLNSMMDIFSQIRLLDKGRSFGTSFWGFRGQYFIDKNAGMPKDKHFPNWMPKKGAADDINLKLKNISMHVAKKDCLDLPPLVKQIIPVEMSKEQEKAYAEMLQNFIAFVVENSEKEAAVAELALTRALRLQQITTGFVGTEDTDGKKDIHRFKENPRAKVLKEMLADLCPNHKVIVWAVFKENYKDIRKVCEELKLEYVEVHGGISASDKQENVDRFCNDEKVRVFIGHPGSGGIGITLIESDVMIFYSRNFSLEYDIQAEARCYRGGSEIHSKVTRYDLVAPDTIDAQVTQALASKKKIGYSVLKDFVLEDKC